MQDGGPIIFAQSEDLTLFYKEESIKSVPPPPIYPTLTNVSHFTLTNFLLLEPYGEGPVSEARIDSLQHLRNLAETVQGTLGERLTDDLKLVEAQQMVIGKKLSLIKKLWAKRHGVQTIWMIF